MPHPPSTPLYKVNDKVKVINRSPSLSTFNGLKHRSTFKRDNDEIGTIKEVIIEKNITHVVTAIRDPHPKVNGEGIRILKQAGIVVTEGIEADAARLSLAEWLKGYE